MAEFRRSVPRQPVVWNGRYHFNEETADRGTRECRVVDISTLGAGVELSGTTPAEALNQLLVVTVELRGRVQNAREADGGVVRVGLEFPPSGPQQDDYMKTIRHLGKFW
jgi:hypothetical protein